MFPLPFHCSSLYRLSPRSLFRFASSFIPLSFPFLEPLLSCTLVHPLLSPFSLLPYVSALTPSFPHLQPQSRLGPLSSLFSCLSLSSLLSLPACIGFPRSPRWAEALVPFHFRRCFPPRLLCICSVPLQTLLTYLTLIIHATQAPHMRLFPCPFLSLHRCLGPVFQPSPSRPLSTSPHINHIYIFLSHTHS